MMNIGCALHSDDLVTHREILFRLSVLELENFLFPGFSDEAEARLPEVQAKLEGYSGEIILSAPYIDLNPATSDRLVRQVVQARFNGALRFAAAIGARELIFLSSFLPQVRLSFYERDWVENSILFWRSYLQDRSPAITLSLGNLFEERPDELVEIVQHVDQPNFRLAFDLGHFLVYSQTSLDLWLEKAGAYLSTVYVHSNDGFLDTHDPPFRGRLQAEYLRRVRRAAPQARLVLKMNDKDTLAESLSWVRAALDEPGREE